MKKNNILQTPIPITDHQLYEDTVPLALMSLNYI